MSRDPDADLHELLLHSFREGRQPSIGTLNFNSVALAVPEIRGGSQKPELGPVTQPRTPYGLLLHSFR